MSVLILSFSGTGENSITLKSLEVLEHHKDVEKFDKILIKPGFNYEKSFDEVVNAMKKANIVIWAVSPFHMNIQSHMLHFFEECRKHNVYMDNLHTFFITNVRVCDHFLSDILERQIRRLTPFYVHGLSLATNDIINRKMALYRISTPDLPPKKKLFSKPPEFEEGEGLNTAVQWYKIIKEMSRVVKCPQPAIANADTDKARKVLFIDMDEIIPENRDFVTKCVNQLKDFYKNAHCTIEDIAQRNFNVQPCDGCKICYASKECKIKDDYLTYEAKITSADIIIYYGVCSCGFTSSISKKLIDRSVHNGLMPADGKIPDKMEKFQAVGYILDTDPESYTAYKAYQFSIASFSFVHFIGALAPIPNMSQTDLYIMANYSLLVTKEKMLPQRNFWTEKVGKHFSDLSQNIPMVIPEEAKYYKKTGGYDPIPLDPNAKTIMPETVKLGAKMRLIPYDKMIESLDKKYK